MGKLFKATLRGLSFAIQVSFLSFFAFFFAYISLTLFGPLGLIIPLFLFLVIMGAVT